VKHIVGTVLDPEGAPAAGVTVVVQGDGERAAVEATTDASGRFRVEAESGDLLSASGDDTFGDVTVGWADVPTETVEIQLSETEGDECEECDEGDAYEGDDEHDLGPIPDDDGEGDEADLDDGE